MDNNFFLQEDFQRFPYLHSKASLYSHLRASRHAHNNALLFPYMDTRASESESEHSVHVCDKFTGLAVVQSFTFLHIQLLCSCTAHTQRGVASCVTPFPHISLSLRIPHTLSLYRTLSLEIFLYAYKCEIFFCLGPYFNIALSLFRSHSLSLVISHFLSLYISHTLLISHTSFFLFRYFIYL